MKKKTVNTKTAKKQGVGFLEGAFVGAVLGVAAGVLLAPESGKNMRKDIKKLSGDFYRSMAPRIKKLKRVSEAEYNAFVTKGAKEYAKAKQLSASEGNMLVAEAKRSWGRMKKQLQK